MRTRLLFTALLASNMLMAQVPLKVKTSDTEYTVEDATHITFQDDLSVQHVHSEDNRTLDLPMQSIHEVILRDTLHNVSDYILWDEDCMIYRWAFMYSRVQYATYYPYFNFFYSNFTDPAQTNGSQTSFTPELQSRFALFVPVDSAMDTIPYCLSFVARNPAVISLQYTGGTFPFKTGGCVYNYNQETGQIGTVMSSQRLTHESVISFLNEVLMQNTIVFDRPEDREQGIRSGNEYFTTLAGTVVRVAADGKSVQGVLQMDNAAKGIRFSTCNIIDSHKKSNGTIYKIDCPILPPAIQKTAYSILSGEGYEEFFKLCQVNTDVLKALSLIDTEASTETQTWQENFYSNFVNRHGANYNLSFFPSHPFTLYAPTNEAIRQAITDGLPTWESLAEAYGNGVSSDAERAEGKKKVYELINFVRYHFHFGTEIADKLPFAAREHATPVILPEAGFATPRLSVSSAGNGTLSVTDATGKVHHIIDEGKNIFVRDAICNRDIYNVSSFNGTIIEHDSPGVIHRINSVLRYK